MSTILEETTRIATASEIIDDMIGNKVDLYFIEKKKENPDPDVLEALREQIGDLSEERRDCHRKHLQDPIIEKAYTVYAPQLVIEPENKPV